MLALSPSQLSIKYLGLTKICSKKLFFFKLGNSEIIRVSVFCPQSITILCWMFMKALKNQTAFNSKRKQVSEKGRQKGSSAYCSLIVSVILLASCYSDWNIILWILLLEYPTHDTAVRSAPQPECHQSTSQHTVKMTSAAPLGGVHVSAKSLLSASGAVV